jgi:hypothetical protein
MISRRSKYIISSAKLWFTQCVLLFAIFSFSGFNQKILDINLDTDKIELVDHRSLSSFFYLDVHSENTSQLACIVFPIDVKTNNYSSALLNYNQAVEVSYKSISTNLLTYNYNSLKHTVRTLPSSGDDELPSIL